MTTKVERQLTLLDVLLRTPRPLDLEEIRSRVPGYAEDPESFRRTFERDKVDLRVMGVPLEVAPIPATDPPNVGYRIDPRRHALRDPGLDEDETEALRLASAFVGSRGLTGALLKLGVGLSGDRPEIEVPVDPELSTMFTAVVERRLLRFRYRGVDRVVEPHRLQFRRGRWYLHGHDRVRAATRWYRIGRIESEVEADDRSEAFARPDRAPEDLVVDPWQLGEAADPVRATVRFDAAIAPAVRAELANAEIVEDGPDGLVVTLTVTNRDGFRSWVLTYLDRVEVLDPQELRDDLITHLEDLARG